MVIKIFLLLILIFTIILIWHGANNIILNKEGLNLSGIKKVPQKKGRWDITDTRGYKELNLTAYGITQYKKEEDFVNECIKKGPKEMATILVTGTSRKFKAYYTSSVFNDSLDTNINPEDISPVESSSSFPVMCDANMMPKNYSSKSYPPLKNSSRSIQPDPYFFYSQNKLHYFADKKLFKEYGINDLSEFDRYNCSSASIGANVLPKQPKEKENLMCDIDQMPKGFDPNKYTTILDETDPNNLTINESMNKLYSKYNQKGGLRIFNFSNKNLHYYPTRGTMWSNGANNLLNIKLYNCSSLSIGSNMTSPLPKDEESISCFENSMPIDYQDSGKKALPGQPYPYFEYLDGEVYYYSSKKIQNDNGFNASNVDVQKSTKQYDCSNFELGDDILPSKPKENEDIVCHKSGKPKNIKGKEYDYYRYFDKKVHGYPKDNDEIYKTNNFNREMADKSVYNCSNISIGADMEEKPFSSMTNELPENSVVSKKGYYPYNFAATDTSNPATPYKKNAGLNDCANYCHKSPNCLGFSLDKYASLNGDCYLKTNLDKRSYKNSTSITYVKRLRYSKEKINPLGNTSGSGKKRYTIQKFSNSLGSGVLDKKAQMEISDKTVEECKTTCDNLKGCLGFYRNKNKVKGKDTCVLETSNINNRTYGNSANQYFYRRDYGPFDGTETIPAANGLPKYADLKGKDEICPYYRGPVGVKTKKGTGDVRGIITKDVDTDDMKTWKCSNGKKDEYVGIEEKCPPNYKAAKIGTRDLKTSTGKFDTCIRSDLTYTPPLRKDNTLPKFADLTGLNRFCKDATDKQYKTCSDYEPNCNRQTSVEIEQYDFGEDKVNWRCTDPTKPFSGLKGCPDGYKLARVGTHLENKADNDTCILNTK